MSNEIIQNKLYKLIRTNNRFIIYLDNISLVNLMCSNKIFFYSLKDHKTIYKNMVLSKKEYDFIYTV